jgi:hypothetical protein
MAEPAVPQTRTQRAVRGASLTAGGLAVEKVVAALLLKYAAFLPADDVPFVSMGIAVGLTGAAIKLHGIAEQLLRRRGLEV